MGLGNPPTVLEAGWRGVLVPELINHTSNSIRVHSNSGISQILFFKVKIQTYLMPIKGQIYGPGRNHFSKIKAS